MATTTSEVGTTPQPSRAALAAAITTALTDAGISRLEASKRTHIPRETFYRKCRAGSPFDSDELAALADTLGITVSALVARAEQVAA
jgi:hypothetical protein